MKLLLAGAAIALALLMAPAAAPAVTACDFGNGVLEVQMPASATTRPCRCWRPGRSRSAVPTGRPARGRRQDAERRQRRRDLRGYNGVGAGGTKSFVARTGSRRVRDGRENGGTPEIEISVNLNDRPDSLLMARGGHLRLADPLRRLGDQHQRVRRRGPARRGIFPAGVPALVGMAETAGAACAPRAGTAPAARWPLRSPCTAAMKRTC